MSYGERGYFIGILAAALTFLGAWGYCAFHYGFLLGFGLGWLPAAILAAIVGLVVRVMWAPLLLGGALVLLAVVINSVNPQPNVASATDAANAAVDAAAAATDTAAAAAATPTDIAPPTWGDNDTIAQAADDDSKAEAGK